MGIFIDETGNKHGYLTVIGRASGAIDGHVRWLCRCDCGHQTIVQGSKLRDGKTKSCGCLKPNRLPYGVAAFNRMIANKRFSAKERGLSWELIDAQVQELSGQPCYYCGQLPSNEVGHARMNGSYTYNGLDRLDSSEGYVWGNVVPCCKVCNRAKGEMSLAQFRAWGKRLYVIFVCKD